MLYSTTDYSRKVDTNTELLIVSFDSEMAAKLSETFSFETEDSNFAPEPSVACRVRSKSDFEFTLIWLMVSKRLLVLGEAGVNKVAAKQVFLEQMPDELKGRVQYELA